MFGWVARKPKLAFWLTLGLSLFVGLVIGVAAASNQAELDKQTARADQAETKLAQVSDERDDFENQLADAKEENASLAAQVKTLSAKGEVPDFTDQDIGDAEDEDVIDAYDWRIKTVREISDRAPGTVISQSPEEGTVLKAGRSITLTVAKKPPPKPPEWVTIRSFSGSGATNTDEFRIPRGSKARLQYIFTGDTNAILALARPGDEFGGDLLLNEIGDYASSTRVYDSGTFYLDVEGGSWTVNVQVFKRPE